MIAHLIAKGDLVKVKLVRVDVQPMAGDNFEVILEEGQNVCRLKMLIQEQIGHSVFSQQIFHLGQSGDAEDDGEVPLKDDALLADASAVALCIAERLRWSKCGNKCQISGEEKLIVKRVIQKQGPGDSNLATGSIVVGGEDGKRRLILK